MPKKEQPQPVYKIESDLKREALERQKMLAATARPQSEAQRKWDNYWYHYKWHTIAGIFIVFVLTLFIKDMVFRTTPDMTIIVVTESYVDTVSLERMCEIMEQQASDLNGDGKVSISTDLITLAPEPDGTQEGMPPPDLTGGQQDYANVMKLVTIVAVGTDPVYLLDEASHNRIIQMGQSETDSPDTDNVFTEFMLPAGNLTGETIEALNGMNFYIRTACTDEIYYEYCTNLLQQLK